MEEKWFPMVKVHAVEISTIPDHRMVPAVGVYSIPHHQMVPVVTGNGMLSVLQGNFVQIQNIPVLMNESPHFSQMGMKFPHVRITRKFGLTQILSIAALGKLQQEGGILVRLLRRGLF